MDIEPYISTPYMVSGRKMKTQPWMRLLKGIPLQFLYLILPITLPVYTNTIILQEEVKDHISSTSSARDLGVSNFILSITSPLLIFPKHRCFITPNHLVMSLRAHKAYNPFW